MERYLGDETIDYSELAKALASGVASGTVFPVLCGSATKLIGIDRLAKFLIEEAPAPGRRRRRDRRARVQDDRRPVRRPREPLQGAAGHGRSTTTCSRTRIRSTTNACTSSSRCAARSRTRSTRSRPATSRRSPKLAAHRTGDVLAAKGTTLDVDVLAAPKPLLAVAIHAKSKADEDKLANALHRLQEEDPVLAHRAQRRDAPDRAARHGRDPPVDRAREAAPQVRRRGRNRRRARRVPRDDQRTRRRPKARSRSRAAATASSRSRGCASNRSRAAAATSSSTRSSAA